MSIVPAPDWFYLHNAPAGERPRLSRVAFFRIEFDADGVMHTTGIINESTGGTAVMSIADPAGGVFLQAGDLQRGHMYLLAELRDRITPPPPAIPGPMRPAQSNGSSQMPPGVVHIGIARPRDRD